MSDYETVKAAKAMQAAEAERGDAYKARVEELEGALASIVKSKNLMDAWAENTRLQARIKELGGEQAKWAGMYGDLALALQVSPGETHQALTQRAAGLQARIKEWEGALERIDGHVTFCDAVHCREILRPLAHTDAQETAPSRETDHE